MTAYDLMADNGDGVTGFKAGEVQVWNDDDTLYVKYKITDMDWCLTGTHLAVAATLAEIPQNKSHNPKVGQFDFSESHDCVAEYTYHMPLPTYDPVIAAHADLLSIDVAAPGDPFWASNVFSSTQGSTKGGNVPVAANRSIPGNALGAASVSDDLLFFALGFGGEIVVEFDGWVYNGDGYDISVHETTWGNPAKYGNETAEVFGLYEGDWVSLGLASNHDPVGDSWPDGISWIELGDLPYVEMVKIVDTTSDSYFDNIPLADAYDVDAVDAPALYYGEESGWAGDLDFGGKSWATYFNYDILEFRMLESVSVPSTNQTGTGNEVVSSDGILTDGMQYELRASGTYDYGPGLADAQCSDRPGPTGWVNGDDLSHPNFLEVWMNGAAVDWQPEPCNVPDHTYTKAVMGTGTVASFTIMDACYPPPAGDGCYYDNIGDLTVDIWGWAKKL